MTTEATTAATPILGAVQMIIGGEKVDAADGQTFEVINPATGELLATAPLGGPEDVNRAVAAAQKALDEPKGFSSWSAAKRGRTLQKLSNLAKEHLEELAQLESQNVGKPIAGARWEALAVGLVFEYYAGAANKHFGETIPASAPGLDFTLREPIGVVGLIVPWNFPHEHGLLEARPGAGHRQRLHPQARLVHAAHRAQAGGAGRWRPGSRPGS